MIIVQVRGGLGNQLQQYALCEKLKALGKEALLDLSWYEEKKRQDRVFAKRDLELRLFDHLELDACDEAQKRRLLGGGWGDKLLKKMRLRPDLRFEESRMYHPEIFTFENRYLEGYWACEKYYADILPQLREKIKFRKSTNIQNIEAKEQMKSENSVSIHIRRGDYLDPENTALFGGICTEAYYQAAETYIRERVGRPHFYLFSDDPDYLRAHYRGEEYTVVDWNRGADSLYDMELMSCCRHHICANSTFSFWGARLNPEKEKIMIRPLKHKNGQAGDAEEMKELWKGWVLVDGEGKVF